MAVIKGECVPWWFSVLYKFSISRWDHHRLTRIRSHLLSPYFGAFGEGSTVSFGTRILQPNKIFIGDRTSIPNTSVIDGRGGLTVGDDCLLGFENIILTSTHRSADLDLPIRRQGMFEAPVHIGDDVWTGCRVVIVPGVKIGDHSIIGAGSVVTRDIPAWSIFAGSPAKLIRDRREIQSRDEQIRPDQIRDISR